MAGMKKPSLSSLKCASFLAFILVAVHPPSASAHARMIRSSPERNAQIAVAPEQIDLWFNELLDEGFNSVDVFPTSELSAKTHTNLAKGDPKVDPKDHTHLCAKVRDLPPGDYVVDWRVLSRDGHSAPGRLFFHLDAKR